MLRRKSNVAWGVLWLLAFYPPVPAPGLAPRGPASATPVRLDDRPLGRTFAVGASQRYRLALTLRSELDGQRPVRIGRETYVEQFSRFAEARLEWQATRRVVAIRPGGDAEVQEILDHFSGIETDATPGDEEAGKLREAVRAALTHWVAASRAAGSAPQVLRYAETPSGQLRDLKAEGVPVLDEVPPPLLTPWLLRALRPAALLPTRPIRFDERWQEPRAAELPHWSDVRAIEAGEWLEVENSPEPAVRLHVVQQISGKIPSVVTTAGDGAETHAPQEADARFHGESLTTISLEDGGVLAATRSATRETSWTLPPVAGLTDPPSFRGRLMVEVKIEGIR